MKWHNTLGGAEWQSIHDSYTMQHRLYYSYFANRLGMAITEIGVDGNNSFAQAGLEGSFRLYPGRTATTRPRIQPAIATATYPSA